MTLRNRIYLSMVLLVLLSFVIIGAITIWYTQYENEKYHYERLARKERAVVVSLNYFLKEREDDSLAFYTREFHQKVQELADINKLDVNLFDLNGQWVASSDFDFFDLGYIPEVLSDDLLKELNESEGTLITQRAIGEEEYLFALRYLRGKEGQPIAIINIPYYRSEQEFKEETEVFLKALTQVYGLMLILGLVIAYLLSNSITRGLKKLENKIRELSLQGDSQEVEWEGKDEIGSLVEAYNQKVRELEASASKLAETEREGAWREMAKQVAHEIKNPLTPMLLQVQQLERSWKDGREDFQERLTRFHKTMTEQIETLSRIATEFSTFAKLPEAQLQEVNLVEVAQGVASLFQKPDSHEITVNCEKISMRLMADKDQMTRVFTNLIGNAVEAIPPSKKGEILVDLQFQQDNIEVKISDNGVGIKASELDQIFQHNFTTKTRGTGLGLAMVKRIIQHHQGRVEVKSEEGKGTTFILILPAIKTT